MTRREIGAALENIADDVLKETRELVDAFSNPDVPNPDDMIRQAVDTPSRAKARLQAWIAQYDAANGAGSALIFLDGCLTLIGSSETVASLTATINNYEAQALAMVDNVENNGWTFDQVATALLAALPSQSAEVLSYRDLPIPDDYVTVWGDPW